MSGRGVHRASTYLLSLAMIAIGLALIVQSLSDSGPITGRLLLGILFAAAGVGRTYVEVRRSRGA